MKYEDVKLVEEMKDIRESILDFADLNRVAQKMKVDIEIRLEAMLEGKEDVAVDIIPNTGCNLPRDVGDYKVYIHNLTQRQTLEVQLQDIVMYFADPNNQECICKEKLQYDNFKNALDEQAQIIVRCY